MPTQNKQSLSQRTLALLRALFASKLPDEQEFELWNLPADSRAPGEKTPAEFDDEEEADWSSFTN